MLEQTILVVGEVCVDTHLDITDLDGPLVRLGGIFHSARAFASLDVDYALAYYAPDYLEEDINFYSCILKSKGCYRLGAIANAPNIMLVSESKEAGNQGYFNILKDQARLIDTGNLKQVMKIVSPTDILIYPGRYNTSKIIQDLSQYDVRIHVDFHYDSESILNGGGSRDFETVILSTSSLFFRDQCRGTLDGITDYFGSHHVGRYLVKENRGGAYCFQPSNGRVYESPSYYVRTMHSVGVGDVYNSVFISNLSEDIDKRMRLSALCAAKYAETMGFGEFKNNVELLLDGVEEISGLDSVRLSWEERNIKNIYLAAPDFPGANTILLEELADSLKYHNFCPRLPIRENGLVNDLMTDEEEIGIYRKDIELIDMCDLLIAVLLFNDPGTYVELGMFKQTGKPTIIYDPYDYSQNMFVRHTPDYLCRTVAEVIDATYRCLRRR